MRVPSRSRMKTLHTVAHIAIVGVACGFFAMATVVSAQENDECLMCHEDAGLVGDQGGVEISMFVDPTAYSASVHHEFACIDCHSDLDGVELPHDEDLDVVDCAACHDDMAEDLAAWSAREMGHRSFITGRGVYRLPRRPQRAFQQDAGLSDRSGSCRRTLREVPRQPTQGG